MYTYQHFEFPFLHFATLVNTYLTKSLLHMYILAQISQSWVNMHFISITLAMFAHYAQCFYNPIMLKIIIIIYAAIIGSSLMISDSITKLIFGRAACLYHSTLLCFIFSMQGYYSLIKCILLLLC